MSDMVQRFRVPLLAALCMSALALPRIASGAPTTVTMQTAGSMYEHPFVLDALGLNENGDATGPFRFTVSATFDPDSAGFTTQHYLDYWSDPTDRFSDPAVTLDVALQIDGQQFHFAGQGTMDITTTRILPDPANGVRGGDRFQFTVGFDSPASYNVIVIDSSMSASIGNEVGTTLAPRDVTLGPGRGGYADIAYYASSPDAPWSGQTSGTADSGFLRITSAVPEPGQAGMLAAGLLALAFPVRSRLRRTSCTS